jgi:hypothetical protein
VIADAVFLTLAGIDFCHAVGRSIFSGRLKVDVDAIMPRTWIGGRRQFQPNRPVSIKNA